ncbi:MAG: hypothetical protein JXX29_22445 [Deltaproteobacteria bacterium]|nr:hypothetical protein [Deltaproteobacteria bacterium]MBN2674457.1 hypothetical protein [Deltaproteobacteria bacterium]
MENEKTTAQEPNNSQMKNKKAGLRPGMNKKKKLQAAAMRNKKMKDAPKNNAPDKAVNPGKNIGAGKIKGAEKNVQHQLSENKKAAAKLQEIKKAAAQIPIDYEANARKRRRQRSIQLVVKMFIFVILPTIAATVYYGFYAKDQYQSISAIAVQTEGKGGLGIESVIGTFAPTGSSKDAMTIQEYILSRDMLKFLDENEKFISHYQNSRIDYLARLPKDATFEESFEYYLQFVEASYNAESGVLTLSVRAFDAKSAQRFSNAILHFAEEKVNLLSSKMQHDKITFTETVVKGAEKRLEAAQKALLALQKEQADFSPDHSAQALMGVKNQLEAQLAMAQTELDALMSTMAPTAPQVLAHKQKVQSIRNQIRKENKRLLGSDEGGMGTNIAEFEMAMLEKQFAQKEYESSMVSLELARLEAMKQTKYLAEISSPSLPDEAAFPKRGLKILTAFLVSLAVFGIFSLVLSAVKEHARI